MAEVARFRLREWPAFLVGVGIVAWTAWGFVKHLQPVPAPARDAVQAWLVEDYNVDPRLRHRVVGMASEFRGSDGGPSMGIQGVVGGPPPQWTDSSQVFIESLDAHGWKDFLIAHATVAVRKPDQTIVRAVRFLDLARGPRGEWKVMRENSAWDYWFALVPAPRSGSSWP